MSELRDITQEEWDAYEWVKVTSYGDGDPIYVRGRKRTTPPDDGYAYEVWYTINESEQHWKRIKTPSGLNRTK